MHTYHVRFSFLLFFSVAWLGFAVIPVQSLRCSTKRIANRWCLWRKGGKGVACWAGNFSGHDIQPGIHTYPYIVNDLLLLLLIVVVRGVLSSFSLSVCSVLRFFFVACMIIHV